MKKTEGTAIAALVLAIASFVVCPVIPSIVALILASSARKKIAESGGTLEGESLCTAATIISWINIGLAVLGIVAIVIVAAAGGFDEENTFNMMSTLSEFVG